MTTFEVRRSLRRAVGVGLALLPAIVAGYEVLKVRSRSLELIRQVEAGDLYSAETATAFTALGLALKSSLPITALLVVAFASQSVSGELANGTLRNILMRPLRRVHVALGKATALAGIAQFIYGTILLAALLLGGNLLGFGDRQEIYRGEEPEPVVEAADVWPNFVDLLVAPVLPLLALVAIGFLAGVVARRGVWALAIGLFFYGSLEFGRGFARLAELEWILPNAYLPSLFADTSYVEFFTDSVQGSDDAYFKFASTATWVPLGWAVACFGLSALLLSRRPIK